MGIDTQCTVNRQCCEKTAFDTKPRRLYNNRTMELFDIIAALLTLSALFSYINYRYLRLPTTVGLMVIALLFSIALNISGYFLPEVERAAESIIGSIDFNRTLMHGMLGFLLFAGALHVDLPDLSQQKWTICLLASVGVSISTAIVGLMAWQLLALVGLDLDLIYCLLFGALISPTDPIAVIGIMKKVGAPKSLEIKIAGESLFNDGVGVVIFIGLLEIATGEQSFDPQHLATLFVQEAIGGALFGLVIGWVAFVMLKSIDNYQVEILISLAVVAGGYSLAMAAHLSGPIAMVAAGLLLGNHGRALAMSPTTREHLDTFWELIDEILNGVLFVLIGLEMLVLTVSREYFIAALMMIPVVLFARWVAVGLPIAVLKRFRDYDPHVVKILTWGGLRGGISVALALSIPTQSESHAVPQRDVLLVITYVVVVFSIIVQGLSIGPLIRRLTAKRAT